MNNFAKDFPLLSQTISNHKLVYFDSSATTPKPRSVISALTNYYETETGNPGRGNHTLSFNASRHVEETRKAVLTFFDADHAYEAAFTKNATEAINMVAYAYARKYKNHSSKPLIIVTEGEHHANFLPWQRLHQEEGFPLHIAPILPSGSIDYEDILTTLQRHTGGLLAITHASNVTGVVTKLVPLIEKAKEREFEILLDATQSAPHFPLSLRKLPITYLAASAHKMYGPEGLGFLLLKKDVLDSFSPLLVGGGIIKEVTINNTLYIDGVGKLEAGTLHTGAIRAFTPALEYIAQARDHGAFEYEEYLHDYFTLQFKEKAGPIYHPLIPFNKTNLPIFAFYSRIHAHDIADYLDRQGIAVRAGHHCAQMLHRKFGVPASVRVSLSFYNTKEEIDYFFDVLSSCTKVYQ